MKRILFIAPESFPVMSSEAICNSKVAYSLAKAGYKVDVYTCNDRNTYPTDKRLDEYLRGSENLTIYTVAAKVLVSRQYSFWTNVKNGLKNLSIFLKSGYWYNGISIPYGIFQAIEKNIRKWGGNPYDVMITRGFVTEYAGIRLKQKYGIKWIANWNDPYPDERFPAPYGKGFDCKLPYLTQKILDDLQQYVDMHTFPSDRLRKYMLRYFNHTDEAETLTIPHMAHSEILPLVKKDKEHDGLFNIVHCGSVGKPRDPRFFLQALSNVISSEPVEWTNCIRCNFVGNYDADLDGFVKKLGLEQYVKLLPPLVYADSLAFISTCDMALIVEAICEEGIYMPTKFVDSLQCGLPVFCVSPHEGTLKDMVNKYGVGYYCDNTSVKDIEVSLRKAITDFHANKLPKISKENLTYFFENDIVAQFSSIL